MYAFFLGALDQQKELYEQKLEELRRERTPDTSSGRTSSGYNSEDRLLNSTPTSFIDRFRFERQFLFKVIANSNSRQLINNDKNKTQKLHCFFKM